jgi:hypothetical protein
MVVWELHDSLARSIGDPLIKDNGTNYTLQDANSGVPMPDGVRYTTAIRNQYLNKAMLSIQNEALKTVAGLSRFRASVILQRLFPSMLTKYTLPVTALGVQPSDQLFIYTVLVASDGIFPNGEQTTSDAFKVTATPRDARSVRNIPILDYSTVMMQNARGGAIRPDLMAYTSSYGNAQWLGLSGREIVDMENSMSKDHTLEISYFPLAPRVDNLAPSAYVEFEPTWEPTILNKAIMYAQLDSGELGAAYQAVPFIEQMSRGSNANA